VPGGAPRFHVEPPIRTATEITLGEHAAHHAARVLRLREGDAVVVFDGCGGEHLGRITAIAGKSVRVQLEGFDPVDREAALRVTLVQGLSSTDRMDYSIQKAVELGASAIVPVVAEKSVVRLAGERAEARARHWRRIAIAACEQSGRNRIPDIGVPVPLAHWLARIEGEGADAFTTALRLLALPGAGQSLPQVVSAQTALPGSIIIAVGPEAGFSQREDEDLLRGGFTPVRLGPRILRTETVAPALLAALNVLAGDWR